MSDFVTVTWSKLDTVPEWTVLIGAILGITFAVYYMFTRKKDERIRKLDSETIESYQNRLASVEDETRACNKQHNETKEMVKHLQGQLDVLKDIPLKGINDTMKLIHEEVTDMRKNQIPAMVRNQRDIIKLIDGGEDGSGSSR